MSVPDAPIGSKVQVAAGIGHVRWTGTNPKFSTGQWVGIELLEPKGKNDGTVQGDRYFNCAPKYGVFVRQSQVKILELPKATSNVSSTTPRPAVTPSGSRTTSTTAASRVTSPQKPRPSTGPSTPTRAVSRASTNNASPPQAPPRRSSANTAAPVPIPRQPLTRPPSSTEPAPSARRAPTPAENDARAMPPPPIPTSSSFTRPESAASTSRPLPSRTLSMARSASGEHPITAQPAHTASRPATPDKETVSAFAGKRELEELRIKIRILENRRTDDQEKIKSLESKAAEADTLKAARVKLQSKFQELQTSLVAAQRQARDLQSDNTHLESKVAEANDQLEMVALDREVAEEKAEAAEAEVTRLGEKISEMEVEVAILKEENAEYEKPVGAGDGERSSIAFVQLEKHNERLKEALIRLRDVSSEADREHKARLAELEKELSSQEELIGRLEMSEVKLANAEAQIDDLKIQLDDALGAEDMLEQLTDRNLQLGERLEEMRITVEDLEALKELNDELEENHVESEKQLNAEIDTLGVQLRDEKERSEELDGAVLDMEATISQFRDLVASLQIEIDDLRQQQVSAENETATTTKEAQALLNLNMKLQSTAVKAQNKTIDLELKKLESAQLADQMRIIMAYLPDPYYETEADSTTVYLFFKRIGAKVDLLISTISTLHGLPGSLHTATSEILVGICELRGKLHHFSTLSHRFASIISRGTPQDWVNHGKLLPELNGVEVKIDGWISSMRSDEFDEGECARGLGNLTAQFHHLADTAFSVDGLDVGEIQLGLAWGFDADLDNFAAAVGFARQAIVGLAAEDDIEIDVGESSLEEGVYEPVQRILDLVRSVKVPSGKLVSQIEEVVSTAKALSSDATLALGNLTTSVSNAVDLAVQLAQRIGEHAAMLRSTKQPLRLSDINIFLEEVTAESSASIDAPPGELIGMFVTRLGNELSGILPKIKQAVKSGQVVSMDMPPPWLARVASIKEAAAFNVDTERKVARLSEEVKDMLREIKIRDQTLQESGVKVETLERRLEATRKQADQIVELENDVAKAKKQEKVYEDAIEQLQAEQDALEGENAKLRKGQGGDRQANASTVSANEGVVIGTIGGLESAQLAEQVENLRSAIRFLRHENALLKSKDLYNDLRLLPVLPYRPISPGPVPELDPSSPTSPSSPSSTTSSTYLQTPTKPTRHTLETESKLLVKEITAFQTKSRIVDVSQVSGVGQGWKSRRKGPERQVWEWKEEEKMLEWRVEGLKERAKGLEGRSRR